MTKRMSTLIGSMPFADERDAMTKALDALGDSLYALPDGEIGERTDANKSGKRSAWIVSVFERCLEDPDTFEVVRDMKRNEAGLPADYEHVPRFKPKYPPGQLTDYLNLGYHEYYTESYPIFKELRAERNLDHVKFQVGIPSPMGLTMLMLSIPNVLRYTNDFSNRLAYEINQIMKEAGDDVIFQIELVTEVVLAHRLPSLAMGMLLRSTFDLLSKIDAGAKIGFHLCVGDLNNKKMTEAETLDKLVLMANTLIKGFPSKLELLYMHFPLAEAADPPTMDAAYYAPLKDVKMPGDAKLIAGFVHEKRTVEELRQIRDAIEGHVGHEVGVACSCGLGRRSSDVALQLLDLTDKVAEA